MSKKFITIKLLQIIGLTVTKDEKIQDQDNRSIINYRGEVLTYNNFNPIENRDLARSLYKYFLNKLEYYSNTYCMMYYEDIDTNNNTVRIITKTTEKTYISEYYNNVCLAYIDSIFIINSINTNALKQLDI